MTPRPQGGAPGPQATKTKLPFEIYVQTSEPSSPSQNDVWYPIVGGAYKPAQVYDGSQFVTPRDELGRGRMLAVRDVTAQASEPTVGLEGAAWVPTDGSEYTQPLLSDGSMWVPISPPPGRMLYYVDSTTADIFQRGCSTAFDISSAASSTRLDTTGFDSDPSGMAWNDDGTKLYFIGFSDDNIDELDCSTPFDISTADTEHVTRFAAHDGIPAGLEWNDDGSKLYFAGRQNTNLYEYDCSTPFDISSADTNNVTTLDVSGLDGTPGGMAWNGDGSKLYYTGNVNDNIDELDCSTPFDISSANTSSPTTLNIGGDAADPRDVTWNGAPQYSGFNG